jgi:hypothetical protein
VGPRTGLGNFAEDNDDDDYDNNNNNNNNVRQPGNNIEQNIKIFRPKCEITTYVNVFAGLCVCVRAFLWVLSQRLGLRAGQRIRHYPSQ